ncbi:uncharacterized protein Z520_02209 [Fonsecaea multimorphosa CBS 102226]|uniref:Fungal N-terminal domain-containing protein n=1 Tax=Fonsecaea multimorphosa CBS 102226 TaxID=1442371 RepID=A0A0D2HJK3_9EURO|nr:uncharacterized protein Z520_02209 [Fonsecaea multimorphosa CBS 102226]KIY02071.1 hypothetical protein Z520_02209 [Fonsecaea multimorphosa CBS 102226]
MSEPLSTASSVFGVVSLGLTVCQGLVSYLSDFKGQAQYVDSLTQKVENLQNCLTLLEQGLPLWKVRFPYTAPQIQQHIIACDPSLKVLKTKLSGFKQKQGPSLRRDKLHDFAQKAAFPFRKPAIAELSGIIDGLQQNLNTVLLIVGLERSSTHVTSQNVTNTKIDAILSASGIMTAWTQDASHDLSVLRAEISAFRNDLEALKAVPGPSGHTVIQQLDGPTPPPRLQTLQPQGQVQFQHLPDPNSLPETSHQVLQRRPTPSTVSTLKWSWFSICLCPKPNPRRPPRTNTLVLSYLQTKEHEEDCPYYLPMTKKRSLAIWISYRSVLISRGIRCMASLVTGSAGNSISATIDWSPIVSSKISSAIQLLIKLKDIHGHRGNWEDLLDKARTELTGLFAQRKAHPREVDEDGRSLLYVSVFMAKVINLC